MRYRNRLYNARAVTGSKSNEITDWLAWFAETILEAQRTTLTRLEFSIARTRFFDRFCGRFNPRQEKAVVRLFRAGIGGFKGDLRAENDMMITGTRYETTTRDLQDLVAKGALTRTGERRHTRYWLKM